MNPEILEKLLTDNNIEGCIVLLHVDGEKLQCVTAVHKMTDMSIVKGLAATIANTLKNRKGTGLVPDAILHQAVSIQLLCDISMNL